jgi:hypothetical protein
LVNFDFILAALFLWITLIFAALSIAEKARDRSVLLGLARKA